ncbi:MAG: segregation/condensation protein A [ANME-2 cluster archaeon]|nr:segregation/condensation protein A [ANME-2 cluster archaeon]MDF1557013.1 ScpA family protein [ANME-2 cluster archaeon]
MQEVVALPTLNENVIRGLMEPDGFEEPVEILVKLAQDGEIDPWNIDIVDVTDKFFRHVEKMERMDLRISGRTLHYAAILLRMKSNALVEEPVVEDDSWVDDFDFFDVDEYPIPKPPVRRHSHRSVTLNELIMELEKAEVVERRRSVRKSTMESLKLTRHTTEQVLGIAHEEDIEGRVDNLRTMLTEVLYDRTYISLSEILTGDRSNKLMTYISLLFLANMKEVWLEQEELFGELYIRYPEISGVCT